MDINGEMLPITTRAENNAKALGSLPNVAFFIFKHMNCNTKFERISFLKEGTVWVGYLYPRCKMASPHKITIENHAAIVHFLSTDDKLLDQGYERYHGPLSMVKRNNEQMEFCFTISLPFENYDEFEQDKLWQQYNIIIKIATFEFDDYAPHQQDRSHGFSVIFEYDSTLSLLFHHCDIFRPDTKITVEKGPWLYSWNKDVHKPTIILQHLTTASTTEDSYDGNYPLNKTCNDQDIGMIVLDGIMDLMATDLKNLTIL